MLSERCKNRIFNCKFWQATQYLKDAGTAEEKRQVRALADRFGDVGWCFDEELDFWTVVGIRETCRRLGAAIP